MTYDLSVVLIPDGELGSDLAAMATAWSRAGLLRSSVWLSPDCVESVENGPPQVRCSYIAGGASEEADLFTIVGLQRLERVRLLVVHPSGLHLDAHTALNRTGLELARLLAAVLPLGTGEDDRGTQLHRVKLLVPTSGSSDLPHGALQADWEVNAVVSPEDRPDVDRGSVFVRAGLNQLGHICNAICAVGGIWDGMPSGALDTVTSDSTTSDGWLHVIRPTVRAVSGGNRLGQLTGQTVRILADVDPSDFVRWGRRTADPELLAERGVRHLLKSENWDPPRSVKSTERKRDERSAGEVIGHAVQYNLRLFGTGWRWLVRSTEESIGRTLTGKLVGQESDIHVALRPTNPARLTQIGEIEESAANRTLGESVAREGVGVDTPAAETWRDLRHMAMSLVDGGDLPEAVRPVSGSLVDVLPRPWAVPAPDDSLLLAGRRLGIVDVVSYREQLSIANIESQPPDELDAPEVEHTDKDSSANSNAVDEGTAATTPAPPQAPQGREDASTVNSWLTRRSGTFMWVLAAALADRLAAAQTRRTHLESLDEVTTNDAHQGLAKAYRRLVQYWRAGVIAIVVGVLLLAWARIAHDTSVSDLVAWASLGLVIWVAVIAWANHQYFKADLKYRRQIALKIAQRRANADELVTLRHTISWLQVRYDGLMLWAPILAEIIHRPWGAVPQTASSMSPEEIEQLPAAVGIAVSAGAQQEEFTAGVITDAVNVLCPQSYLRGLWTDTFDDFLEQSGRSAYSGMELIDGDELQTQASPRRELLEFIEMGSARERAARRALARLTDAVDEREVRLPSLLVKRLGPYSDGRTVAEEAFYAASLRSATPFTIDFWTPEGQVASKHLVSRSMVWLPSSLDESPPPSIELAHSHGRVAVRVDLSRRCSVEDIVAFVPRDARRDAPSWTASDFDKFN